METPSQLVPSFDHLVTQWMSFVISSEGSALNSSHVHLLGLVYLPHNGEVPLLKGSAGRWTGGENWEAVHQILTGWELSVLAPAAAPEAAGEEPFTHVLYLLALSLVL
jgi:hypothetical protein